MARVAIYYAPQQDDPLTHLGSTWIGRDPTTNASMPQPTLDGIDEFTAEPRLYGFHATLKPPMHLVDASDWGGLVTATRTLADSISPFDLPRLAVFDLLGFLALQETIPCPALQGLADSCVEQLDSFRARPIETELVRRRRAKLSPEQDAMLVRWGYPYVFGTWFFHMTLTRRLSDAEKTVILPAAEAWFAPALTVPRRVEDICIFTQSTPGAALILAERIRLRG